MWQVQQVIFTYIALVRLDVWIVRQVHVSESNVHEHEDLALVVYKCIGLLSSGVK